jgi:3,4-dihydroxy 2-butanone 4-phosphate synthase/GTP cyclohydrolase II
MNPDGTMARVPELREFCREHGLKMISVADLIRYRLQTERVINRTAEGPLSNRFGSFRAIAYTSSVDPETHLALVRGDISATREPVLVRMHAHCTYGDVFGSTACDCRNTIDGSLRLISEAGCGVLVYLHQSSPSLRFSRDGDTVKLNPHVRGTANAVLPEGQRKLQHEAGMGAQILADLGLRKIRLLTNHPRKIVGLEAYGIDVVSQEPVPLEGC